MSLNLMNSFTASLSYILYENLTLHWVKATLKIFTHFIFRSFIILVLRAALPILSSYLFLIAYTATVQSLEL